VEDLEHDLAAPRDPSTFAIAAVRAGAGGTIAFDFTGSEAAVTMLSDHARENFLIGALFGQLLSAGGLDRH